MAKISIPAPCHEKWLKMKPVRHDCRFCATCEKQVVDFTNKTDTEILEHFKKKNGKICGRFRQEQLDRPLYTPTLKRVVQARRSGLTAAAASVAVLLMAQQPLDDQHLAPVQTEQSPVQQAHTKTGKVAPPHIKKQNATRIISGKVVDEYTERGLENVKVKLCNSQYRTTTDANGIFTLEVPIKKLQNGPAKIRLSSNGYITSEFLLTDRLQIEDLSLVFSLEKKRRKKSKQLMGSPRFFL
ncbi:MAG: carboxypeptidase-like regulatory domain-containing protein [Saprospiraceae bacterium]|nr:carboxypeptidase-like regulatory domain-containing protein [Saprospiraceae bacterium]